MAQINWVNAPTSVERLDAAKNLKLQEINDAADEASDHILDRYPRVEKDSWTLQKDEAEAYSNGTSDQAPMLEGIAQRRGITLDDLVQRVLDKVAAYRSMAENVIGQRQALEDQIDAAQTVEEVQAIQWDQT